MEPATQSTTAGPSEASGAATSPIGGQAGATTASAAARGAAASDAGDIVVTGSRIVANGYKAPTPVTVVSTTELLKKAPESIAAGLATLPQFFQSVGRERHLQPGAEHQFGQLSQPAWAR